MFFKKLNKTHNFNSKYLIKNALTFIEFFKFDPPAVMKVWRSVEYKCMQLLIIS